MNTKNYSLLFVIILMISACKKPHAVTNPVKFTSTTYETLGTYDSTGKPNYLVTSDAISSNLLHFIDTILPNGKNLTLMHPEFFTSSVIPDITITQPSDVFITFVKEDGGFQNSIAFYTYPSNQPPTTVKDIPLITYVFPNAGHFTPLQPGNKVKIGRFDVGTSIGFVLMQNAWNSTSKKPDNNAVHFLSTDALNPEVDPKLKRHAVLIDYTPEKKVIIGFEDSDRTTAECDNDFNDVTFYCTVTP